MLPRFLVEDPVYFRAVLMGKPFGLAPCSSSRADSSLAHDSVHDSMCCDRLVPSRERREHDRSGRPVRLDACGYGPGADRRMFHAVRGPARRHLAHRLQPDHALGTDPSLAADSGLSAHRYLPGRAAPLRAGESSSRGTHSAGASPTVTVIDSERDWGPATKLLPMRVEQERPGTHHHRG